MLLQENESYRSSATSTATTPVVNLLTTSFTAGMVTTPSSNHHNNNTHLNNNGLRLTIPGDSPADLTGNLTGNSPADLTGDLTDDFPSQIPDSPIPSATTARWEEEHSLGIWSPKQQVISKPGTLLFAVEDHHEFLIIASEGLWDVFTPQVNNNPTPLVVLTHLYCTLILTPILSLPQPCRCRNLTPTLTYLFR